MKTEERRVPKWETLKVTPGGDYVVFKTARVERRHPHTGVARPYSVIESPDWVNVVALTPRGEMIFVRQYRHGVDELTLEIPGGMVDAGESAFEAARRELREETGYTSEEWRPLGVTRPNPALQTNRCDTWLALNAQKTHSEDWDPGELMVTELLGPEEVEAGVSSGAIDHALVLVALYWHQRATDQRGAARGGGAPKAEP